MRQVPILSDKDFGQLLPVDLLNGVVVHDVDLHLLGWVVTAVAVRPTATVSGQWLLLLCCHCNKEDGYGIDETKR